MAFDPIETIEEVREAVAIGKQRIAEVEKALAALPPDPAPFLVEATVAHCRLTALRLKDVPAPGEKPNSMLGRPVAT